MPSVAGTKKQTLVEANSEQTTSNRRVKDLTKAEQMDIVKIWLKYI